MSWCDKMASTPGVGLRFDHLFAARDEIIRAFEPIMARSTSGDKMQFEIEEKGALGAGLITDDGLKVIVEARNIYVDFHHRVRIKQLPGKPSMEILSNPKIYTAQLEDCIDRLLEVFELMRLVRIERMFRIGIVSNTLGQITDFPPGIQKIHSQYISHFGDKIVESTARVVSLIEESDRHAERCIHNLVVREDGEEMSTVGLDWQRTFKRPQPAEGKSLRRALVDAKSKALAYFEQVAEGRIRE